MHSNKYNKLIETELTSRTSKRNVSMSSAFSISTSMDVAGFDCFGDHIEGFLII
jgi:hypothetical protein